MANEANIWLNLTIRCGLNIRNLLKPYYVIVNLEETSRLALDSLTHQQIFLQIETNQLTSFPNHLNSFYIFSIKRFTQVYERIYQNFKNANYKKKKISITNIKAHLQHVRLQANTLVKVVILEDKMLRQNHSENENATKCYCDEKPLLNQFVTNIYFSGVSVNYDFQWCQKFCFNITSC